MANPRGNPKSLGLTPLAEGQVTGLHRSRAEAEALAWWSSLTAAERGEHIEGLYSTKHLAPAALKRMDAEGRFYVMPDIRFEEAKEEIRLKERDAVRVLPMTPEVQQIHDQIHALLDKAAALEMLADQQPESQPKKAKKTRKKSTGQQDTEPEQATEKPAVKRSPSKSKTKQPQPEKPTETGDLAKLVANHKSLAALFELPKAAGKKKK